MVIFGESGSLSFVFILLLFNFSKLVTVCLLNQKNDCIIVGKSCADDISINRLFCDAWLMYAVNINKYIHCTRYLPVIFENKQQSK